MELVYKYLWVGTIAGSLVLSWFFAWIIAKIFRGLHPRLLQKKSYWFAAILEALRFPMCMLVVALGFISAAMIALKHFGIVEHLAVVLGVFHAMLCIALIWSLINFSKKAEDVVLIRKKKNVDRMNLDLFVRAIHVLLIFGGILLILPIFNVSLSGILAFGGIGTIVLGMAAKDMLANVFGGIMITLDKPFKIGDWVSSPEKDIEGMVEHVGWRITKIRTFEKRPVYVPNSLFTTIVLRNPSRMSHRRIRTNINLRYSDTDVVPTIVKEMREYLREHPLVDTDQLFVVNLANLAPDCIEILINVFTKKTGFADYMQVQEEVFLEIVKIVRKNGADFAFPTSSVYLENGDSTKYLEAYNEPRLGTPKNAPRV